MVSLFFSLPELHFHHLSSYILSFSPHNMSMPPHPALPHLRSSLNVIFVSLICPSSPQTPSFSILTVTLMYSFLILSFLVTSIANLNIFISATSISFTCFFVTATVSSSCTITGLTTELHTFPFTLAGNLLSQITPDTLLHPFHPACTLFFTSLLQPPLSCTDDPKYVIPLLLALLYPPSLLFLHYFLHLCTNIRSSTYLLSSLFFSMHTSRILVCAPLLNWSLRKS